MLDAAAQRERAVPNLGQGVSALAYGPDGKLLAAEDTDGTDLVSGGAAGEVSGV